ncbi:MAG: hypothetical protein JWR02_1144 [Mucilaginibacter sp.]|nr:hypothetical protein [Mucilaginibacter sp.]
MIALASLFFAKVSLAQKELLSFDENNRYIYYQVADAPGLREDTLLARVSYFLKPEYSKIKLNRTANPNLLNGSGKFLVYGGGGLLKHEHGEIGYSLNIECKDQKYRYWLTGFVFTPYQRDRYGNFVPEPGKEIPLEAISNKLGKKDADSYLDETGTFCKQLGDRLKLFMTKTFAPKKAEVAKRTVTDKW